MLANAHSAANVQGSRKEVEMKETVSPDSNDSAKQESHTEGNEGEEFLIAISHAGQNSEFIASVVADIHRAFPRVVFYDKDDPNIEGRADLKTYLRDIFLNKAKFIIVFMSEEYNKNRIAQIEFEFIWSRYKNHSGQQDIFWITCDGAIHEKLKKNEPLPVSMMSRSDKEILNMICTRYRASSHPSNMTEATEILFPQQIQETTLARGLKCTSQHDFLGAIELFKFSPEITGRWNGDNWKSLYEGLYGGFSSQDSDYLVAVYFTYVSAHLMYGYNVVKTKSPIAVEHLTKAVKIYKQALWLASGNELMSAWANFNIGQTELFLGDADVDSKVGQHLQDAMKYLALYEQDKNARSYYRDTLGKWRNKQMQLYPVDIVDSFLAMVDLAYNSFMCHAIALNPAWVLNDRYSDLIDSLKDDNEKYSCFQRYTEKPEEITQKSAGLSRVDWSAISDTLSDIDRLISLGEIQTISETREWIGENHFMSYRNINRAIATFESILAKTSRGTTLCGFETKNTPERGDFIQQNSKELLEC